MVLSICITWGDMKVGRSVFSIDLWRELLGDNVFIICLLLGIVALILMGSSFDPDSC